MDLQLLMQLPLWSQSLCHSYLLGVSCTVVYIQKLIWNKFVINYLEFVHFKANELFTWTAIVLEVCDFVLFISRFYVGCLAHVFGLFSYLWVLKNVFLTHYALFHCHLTLSTLSFTLSYLHRSFLSSSALLV